jgi:curli biogenesis system outer membrane secretion channel CsgG
MNNHAISSVIAALLALASGEAASQGAGKQLERCDETLGTVAVVEDHNASWYHTMQQYKVQSTVPLLRMLAQKSNCFVVVERGQAMNVMRQERNLDRSGESREGSNFEKGQLVAADFALNPTITFSARDTGGISGALSGITNRLGTLGSIAGAALGQLKFREAATMLTLVDTRSGVQLAAAEGNSSNTDFNVVGGLLGGSGSGSLGGYTDTPEGKVIASSFADAFNALVRSVKNYKAQEVKGGLGTGGRLGVQGGSTPASKALDK